MRVNICIVYVCHVDVYITRVCVCVGVGVWVFVRVCVCVCVLVWVWVCVRLIRVCSLCLWLRCLRAYGTWHVSYDRPMWLVYIYTSIMCVIWDVSQCMGHELSHMTVPYDSSMYTYMHVIRVCDMRCLTVYGTWIVWHDCPIWLIHIWQSYAWRHMSQSIMAYIYYTCVCVCVCVFVCVCVCACVCVCVCDSSVCVLRMRVIRGLKALLDMTCLTCLSRTTHPYTCVLGMHDIRCLRSLTVMHIFTVFCSMLQCVAACCSVLQRVAACCSVLQHDAACCSVMQRDAAWCSMMQRVAACCSVLQRVAADCGCHLKRRFLNSLNPKTLNPKPWTLH